MFSRFTSSRFTFIALIVLGIALLTVGLVKGYLDTQAHPPLFSSPDRGGMKGGGVTTATSIPPTFTPLPPTATTATTSPATAFSPTPSTISLIPTAIASSTSTPDLTLAVTPSPTFTPTPPGPPPASAPPDRIVIPAIGLDAPVVPVGWTVTDEGPVWDAADYAAGWHQGSAYPGHVGNTVLSGHHNIKGKVFRYLIDLEPDDEVLLYVGDTAYHYVVTEKHLFEEKGKPEAVRRANAQWIAPTDDERLTLLTCWPYTSNTHRLIIVARKLEIGD
jgi:LPXTG-site transpeptidase (sortase) family protein